MTFDPRSVLGKPDGTLGDGTGKSCGHMWINPKSHIHPDHEAERARGEPCTCAFPEPGCANCKEK